MDNAASMKTRNRRLTHHSSPRSAHRTLRLGFLSVALATLLSACATTPPPPPDVVTQTREAFLRDDYQSVLTLVQPLAEQGETWAQYTLGYMYYYGRGIAQDKKTGERWIRQAAAAGHPTAQEAVQRIDASAPRSPITKPLKPEPRPQVEAPAPVEEAPPPVEDIRNTAWILEQDPTHYTIQLIGAGNERAIRDYIQRHGIAQQAAYFPTLNRGHPWYTVIYGDYASEEAAKQAMATLPATLNQAAPWIRDFGSIQILPHVAGARAAAAGK